MIDNTAATPAPEEFLRLSEELEWARKDSSKPQHLERNIRRAALRAVRLLFRAVEAGQLRWPTTGPWAPRRPQPPTDDYDFSYWDLIVVGLLATERPEIVPSDSTALAIGTIKTDDKGRPLGPDGKPTRVSYYDKDGKRLTKKQAATRPLGQVHRRRSPVAAVEDDYDDHDWLAHLQAQAVSYAACCRVLAEMSGDTVTFRAPYISWTKVADIVEYPSSQRGVAMVGNTLRKAAKRAFERERDNPLAILWEYRNDKGKVSRSAARHVRRLLDGPRPSANEENRA